MKCTELEALERIRDMAHAYGALPAAIERLADHELRRARLAQGGCDTREAVLAGALRKGIAAANGWVGNDGHVQPIIDWQAEACIVLADTSLAAAALLAQGEEIERASRPLFTLARDAEGTCRSCGVPAPVMHDPQCVWTIFRATLAPQGRRRNDIPAVAAETS